MKIDIDFPGGNIDILSVEGDTVRVKPQMRDTRGNWFYWAFRVCGAQGRCVTFDFSPYDFIGYHGPAVSRDLREWRWTGEKNSISSFSYTFAPDEVRVYFAHDMLYGIGRFNEFAERAGLPSDRLCVSEKGREIPVVSFGEGDGLILLTARHHCCESTGSYVLEGVLDELRRQPIPGYRQTAVPFVDFDGVVDGDQGKNRIPHDHNRDYIDEPIYKSVAAVKKYAENNSVRFAFDFHSPWHIGGRNDRVFIVRGRTEDMDKYIRLGSFLEKESGGRAMVYSASNDINPGEEWNTRQNGLNCSFSSFCGLLPDINLALSLETTYFGAADDIVSQEKLINTGRAYGRALRSYIAAEYSRTDKI